MILVGERHFSKLRIAQYFPWNFQNSVVWNFTLNLGNKSILCACVKVSVSRYCRIFIKYHLSLSNQKFSLWLK